MQHAKQDVTYISMVSNSSRFRCRLRKAAARFLTRRASRLLRPETSGGMKSLVETAVVVRVFLQADGVTDAARLDGTTAGAAYMASGARCDWKASTSEAADGLGGKSKTWWVDMQSDCSGSEPSGLILLALLSMRAAGTGECMAAGCA